MATVLECSRICPPPDSLPEFSLPLVFFDMLVYDLPANLNLFFFDFPCSESHLLETVVPDLKASLSLTLGQFLPVAGKIVHPLTNPEMNKPRLHYESGDSVSLTVSKSAADLNHLTGNHPRACEEFYAFAPCLPPATHTEKSICCPVLAVQVTLFPGQGLCICLATHHAVFDASTLSCFVQAWAVINRTKPDGGEADCDRLAIRARLAEANCLPFFDRKTVTNINGLDSTYWDLLVKTCCQVEPLPVVLPVNMLRATFVLKKDEIRKLKDMIPDHYVSSFTVTCALVWFCSAKSAGEDVADCETECFSLIADCRGRLEPPLPPSYFGNCVALFANAAELKHGQVKGPDGFVIAAKAIGEAIKSNVQSQNGILSSAHNWPGEFQKIIGKRRYTVSGSPKFDFYALDYGWGKLKKLELLCTDDADSGSISLSKSRDSEGDFEIGLSKPMLRMDAFATVFRQVLADFCNSQN